jgi:DNA-binding NarL/FixJ family response regulator
MEKIFVVEDSPLLMGRIKQLIAAVPGAGVVGEATTAAGAIRGILQSAPDVALVDLNLAEGSGFDVLRALHARLPRVAFYMLSNFSEYPYQQLAERLGAAGYFDKSKDFERLRDLIAQRAAQTQA